MKFYYFTYFLNPLKQKQLLPGNHSREEIINDVLTKEIEFKHRSGNLAYVYVGSFGSYILGKLGKKSSIKRTLPPAEKFKEQHEENWPYCYVVFNTSDNPEKGQRVAFESKSNVFPLPFEQLRALVDHINTSLFVSGYALAINPIQIEQKFWELISLNKNRIQKLTLSFNAPNLFKLDNSFNDDLKELQRNFGITRAGIELENPDGLLTIPSSNKFLTEGIDYITKGGGEYKLRMKGKRFVSSKKNISSKSFDEMEINLDTSNKEVLLETIKKIFS